MGNETQQKGSGRPPCGPALQAPGQVPTAVNRSRKGTSFLSGAGSLRQQRTEGGGRGGGTELTVAPWAQGQVGSTQDSRGFSTS